MTARRKKRAPSKRKAKASGPGSARVAEKARRSRQKTKTRPAVSPKSRAPKASGARSKSAKARSSTSPPSKRVVTTRRPVGPKRAALPKEARALGSSGISGTAGKSRKTSPRLSSVFQRRSDAAKRGWKTRRANIRAKKRLLSDTALRRQVRQDAKKRLHITEPRDVPRWAIEPPEEWVALIEDDFQLDAHEAYTLWYSP